MQSSSEAADCDAQQVLRTDPIRAVDWPVASSWMEAGLVVLLSFGTYGAPYTVGLAKACESLHLDMPNIKPIRIVMSLPAFAFLHVVAALCHASDLVSKPPDIFPSKDILIPRRLTSPAQSDATSICWPELKES